MYMDFNLNVLVALNQKDVNLMAPGVAHGGFNRLPA